MTMPVTVDQVNQITQIGLDTHTIQYEGVSAPGQPDFIPPSPEYQDVVDNDLDVPEDGTIPGEDIKKATISGGKIMAASIVRNLSTHGDSLYATSPNFAISSTTFITVGALAVTYASVRRVLVTVHGTCSTSVANTTMNFRVYINGNQIGNSLKLYLTTASQHQSFSGSFTGLVDVGVNTILLQIAKIAGSGNILMDSDDFINISVIG